MTRLALIATVTGIGAMPADPPFQRQRAADIPDDLHATEGRTHSPSTAAADFGDADYGVRRLPIALSSLQPGAHAFIPAAGATSIPASEAAGEHGEYGPHGTWTGFRPTPVSFGGGYSGGFGDAGGFGGGGARGGDGGTSSEPSQGDDRGQQTQADGPPTPERPERPPYVVDPDNGPHQPGDPQWPGNDPAKDWPPQIDSLPAASSPVPEPAAWLMMISGFAAIGAALRTRRRGPCCTG